MSLRCAWGKVACPVLVAGAYRDNWIREYYGCPSDTGMMSTFDDSGYHAAKTLGDVKAAIEICRHILNRTYRFRVKRQLADLEAKGYGDPIFVAPCKPTSKNALAKKTAEFLGKKLKIEVDNKIQEVPCPSRRDLDRRAKFFQRPQFTGEVEKGRLYIMVDDMVTTGATLAELRSYIVKNGGHVAFACSLASCDGMDKQLNPSGDNLNKVQRMFKALGGTVRDCLKNNTGLTPDTLTDAEADFLASGKGRYALEQYVRSVSPA